MNRDKIYNNGLKKYVNKNLKKGFSIKQIKKKLKESKVPENIIKKVIDKTPHKKKQWFFRLLFGLVLLSIIVLIIYLAFPTLFFQKIPISLLDYPNCTLKNSSIDRYRCYKEFSQINSSLKKCGIYFIEYENNFSKYEKKMSEGEIILNIDSQDTSLFTSNEIFYNWLKDKKINDTYIIITNKAVYNYTYFPGPENSIMKNTSYIYINFGKAYCNTKMTWKIYSTKK